MWGWGRMGPFSGPPDPGRQGVPCRTGGRSGGAGRGRHTPGGRGVSRGHLGLRGARGGPAGRAGLGLGERAVAVAAAGRAVAAGPTWGRGDRRGEGAATANGEDHEGTLAGGGVGRASYWTLAVSRHPAGPQPCRAGEAVRNATRRQPCSLDRGLLRLTPRRNIVGKHTTSSGRWQASTQDIGRGRVCRAGRRPAG